MPKTIKPPKSNLERDMRKCLREVMTDHRDDKVAQEVGASGGALAVLGVDELKPHPKNPRIGMREDVIEAIAASVREHGFHDRHAITVRKTKAGYQIISGHHRVEAARRSGLDAVPAWVIEMDDDQAYMALAADNLQGEMTLVELAIHAAGVKTARGKEGDGVKAWAEAMSRTEEYAHQVRKVGRYLRDEGTKIDLSKLRDKFTHVLAAIEAFNGDHRDAVVLRIAQGELKTVSDVKREAKRAEKERTKQEAVENLSEFEAESFGITHCSLTEWDAPQCQLVFTDPPYHDKHVDRFRELGQFAMEHLDEGRFLCTYTGKLRLLDCANAVTESGMEWVWIFSVYHPFSKEKHLGGVYNIAENWRPVLVFRKPGPVWTPTFQQDVVRGERSKSHHDWSQDEQTPDQLIQAYSHPGETVLDPFCGGGTTPLVAKRVGRKCFACDVDIAAVAMATDRLRGNQGR